MATPTPPGLNQVLGALQASVAAQAHSQQQVAQALTALAHAQQTYRMGPTPGGAPQVPHGGGPPPIVPTVSWLRSQGPQYLLGRLLGGHQPPGTPQPPAPPSTPGAPGGPPTGGPPPAPLPWPTGPGQSPVPTVNGMPWMTPGGYYGGHTGGHYGGGHGGGGMHQWAIHNLPHMAANYVGNRAFIRAGGAAGGQAARLAGMRAGGIAGGVVTAAMLASQIPGEIRSQRDKNAYYQSVEGGSNFAGFGERLHEEAYRWTTLGVLSSDEARQAFKGVTRLGYNSKVEGGPGRQDALNFIYHGKTAYGATVDESLQELQAATTSAVTNFKDLSTALKSVSDSAGKAGINAQMMRAEFTSAMQTAAANGSSPQAALGQATIQTSMINTLGRYWQGTDFSNRSTPGYAMLASAVAGVTPSQYLTGSTQMVGKVQGALDQALVNNVLVPGAKDFIMQQVNASTGGKPSQLTADQAMDIGIEVLRRFYPQPEVLVAVLAPSLGDKADAQHAAQWLVQSVARSAQGGVAGAAAQAAQGKATAAQQAAHQANKVGSTQSSSQSGPAAAGKNGSPYASVSVDSEKPWYHFGFGSGSQAASIYNSWSSKSGQQDPAVAHVLNAISDDNATKVVVSTRSGKRVVSLADAVKNHRDELATGKVAIVSGPQAGKSISDIVSPDQLDPLRNFKAEASRADNSGQSLSSWEAQHVSSNGTVKNGSVTIGLTTEAKRLLMVLSTTGIAGAAASASPPTNLNSAFGSQPGPGN